MADVPLRPVGAKFYGGFVSPIVDDGVDIVDYMFTTWDWANCWKRQIDLIKSAGYNCVGLFGSQTWYTRGTITMGTYLARRKQTLDYLHANGIYAVVYGAQPMYGQFAVNAGSTNSDTISVITQDARLCGKYPNVICYITTDEPWIATDYSYPAGGGVSFDSMVTAIAAQYSAVKAVVPPSLPVVACPQPCVAASWAGFNDPNGYSYADSGNNKWKTNCDKVAPYNDCFPMHTFYENTLSSTNALHTGFPAKDLIITSAVATNESALGQTSDPPSSKSTKVSALMTTTSDARFRGMIFFCVLDWPTHTWALFNSDGTSRSCETTMRAALPSRMYPPRQRNAGRNSRCNQLSRWGYN